MIEQAKDKMTLSDFNPNDHLNDVNTLVIHMKSKKTGARMLSGIDMTSPDSVFEYAVISHNTRSDGTEQKVQSLMKVITSKRIAHRTEVILLEDEQKIIVRMKKEQYERFPRIALIRTDIPSEVIERVQTQDPDYKDFGDVFEYVFENVEQGSYYLFIEPLFLL